MHSQITPGNTHHVATLLGQSQNVSRHTMSSREIAELTGSTHDNVLKTIRGYMIHKVTSLKADTETGVERTAFDPLVMSKGIARLAEINIGASL
ncbi:Rha family transcriptional regulator [Pseudomonas fluorescens]|uniref:Uncharacterized protein n=1 Tax=Pseudomonas fluorescens TaxID=294 RepID=A0A5E7NBK1_PSEFL|nr:Rha family transcriptional regulator [Pseudomonas fluorescens]VVP33900.1 hypothetical protein PS880_04482 [Pseudomonas fluorescens]